MSKLNFIKCSCCNGEYVDLQSAWALPIEETKDFINKDICAGLIISGKGKTEVRCFYGSSLDGNHYQVSKNSCIANSSGNICDNCIKDLVHKKEIVLVSEENWW